LAKAVEILFNEISSPITGQTNNFQIIFGVSTMVTERFYMFDSGHGGVVTDRDHLDPTTGARKSNL
jgi:hypothetical protein